MKSDLPKQFIEGDELTASLVNDILEEIWRWREAEAVPPLHVSETNSTAPPIFSFSGPIVDAAWGETGSGFTAAAGTPPVPTSQTITLYDVTGGSTPVLSSQSSTITAWNPYRNAVAASKLGFFVKTPDGTWWIVTADC